MTDTESIIVLSQEDTEKFKDDVVTSIKKAFADTLTEKMSCDPPAYEWVVSLYNEIRERLSHILKKESFLRKEIEQNMDVELFSQMIRNDAFNSRDMHKLVIYTFTKCKELGSPGRDEETEQKMQEVIDLMESGTANFATIIPIYIVNVNGCIDMIYEDLHDLLKDCISE